MSLWCRFLNLFRPRMSPLGERIAALLAPERWEEWRLGDFMPFDLVHRGSGLELDIWPYSTLIRIDGEEMRLELGRREQSILWRAHSRLIKHLKAKRSDALKGKAEALLTQRLMSEEERAIEDLLR